MIDIQPVKSFMKIFAKMLCLSTFIFAMFLSLWFGAAHAGNISEQRPEALPPLTNKPLTDKAHKLVARALGSVHFRGDYNAAIRYYEEALKEMPGDRGILIALGHSKYQMEKQLGMIKNESGTKAAVLLDALQYGKGNWEASIGYLNDALSKEKDKDRLMAVRDALNTVKGVYEDVKFEKDMEDLMIEEFTLPYLTRQLREGFGHIDKGDYESAARSFQAAHSMRPDDMLIKDILTYTKGLQYGQYERMRNWAARNQSRYGDIKTGALKSLAEAKQALAQSLKALGLSKELDDKEAISISEEAVSIAEQAVAAARSMLSRAEARLKAAARVNDLSSIARNGVSNVIKGEVSIKTPEGWKPFDTGMTLRPGDEISTGKDGFAEFVFTDSSAVRIGPDSTFILHKVRGRNSVYEVLKGRFRAEMKCLKTVRRPCREIRTGAGFTIGVRGTEFDLKIIADGLAEVTVIEGVIDAIDEKSGEKTEVRQGEKFTITAGDGIKTSAVINSSMIDKWWENVSQ
jgi:tetratricopeptide (TPR) repeat protein